MTRLDSLLHRPLTRRRFLNTVGAGTVALTLGAAALPGMASARSTDARIVNTEGARLRSGPGTGYSILASLAKGTEVQYLAYGGSANGYEWHQVTVVATGKQGFIASSLLSLPGTSSPDPVITGSATTTDYVNLRSGPSTSHQVLRVVPYGAAVQTSSTVQGGFRYVIHNGLAGWLADQYLAWGSQPGTGTFTTTSALNLRAEPSTSAKVLLVMPSGAKVTALAGTSPGWRQVSYNGTTGWASTAYLN